MADDLDELDQATIEKMIDTESGTVFDWLEFPGFLELDKKNVIEYPDRTFVKDVIDMLGCDGQAAGVEAALTMPMRQANLTINKPDGDSSGKITDAVEEMLFRPPTEGGMCTPFSTVFAQMTFATAVRRTYHELVWTRLDDGKLGYKKIQWRPPASCELVRDRQTGERRGFKQFIDWDSALRNQRGVDWMGFIEIPPERSVIHINGQHRDPVFGWSDLSVTKWAWDLKRQVLQLWATLTRRTAEPWILAYGKDPGEAKTNAKQIARLRSGGVAGVVRPQGEDPGAKMFDVLDPGAAQAAQLFQGLIGYLDGMMTQSVMAGWMDLAGANNNPARASTALSSDQSGLFLQSRRGAAVELENTVNMEIIRPFVRVNFGPGKPVPLLKVEKMGADQVEKAMAMLQQLGSAQNMNVPPGFIDLLIERVAQYLDLDDEKVRKLIAERAKLARQAQAQAGATQPPPGTEEGNLQDAIGGALSAVAQPPAGGPAPTPPAPPEEAAA